MHGKRRAGFDLVRQVGAVEIDGRLEACEQRRGLGAESRASAVFGAEARLAVGSGEQRGRDWLTVRGEELRSGYVSDLLTGKLGFNPLQHTHCMGWSAGVVAQQGTCLLGQGANNGDSFDDSQR